MSKIKELDLTSKEARQLFAFVIDEKHSLENPPFDSWLNEDCCRLAVQDHVRMLAGLGDKLWDICLEFMMEDESYEE